MELSTLAPEILQKIFWHVSDGDLNRLFRVSSKIYGAAYQVLCRRLPLEHFNPLREIYIQKISIRQYADDWQLRIMRSAVFSQIEAIKDHESSDYEEWLLYTEDEDPKEDYGTWSDDD